MAFIIPAGTGLTWADGGSAGQLLQQVGSTLVSVAQPSVSISGTTAVANSTLVDITGLSFAAAAATTYRFKAWVVYQSSATGCGAAFSVNGPTADLVAFITKIATGITTTAVIDGDGAAYGDKVTGTGADLINADLLAIIEGIVKVSSGGGGTFAVQVSTDGDVGTITVQTKSVLQWQVI